MSEPPQDQTATGSSTAIQAGRDVVLYSGLSYNDVREIALDVSRGTLAELRNDALQIAQQRATEVTDAFLEKLRDENPAGLGQANDPGFQHALFTVQKEHARTGDCDLADLLVDLLVDRTKHASRDILQIVLDESLGTAPKLTESQLSTLSVVFSFRYMQGLGNGSHAELGNYFDKYAKPFVEKLARSAASFQHLQFAGCGAVNVTQATLETLLGKTYQGLFFKGFEASEVDQRGLQRDRYPQLFMICLNDRSKLQLDALSLEGLNNKLAQLAVSDEDSAKFRDLFNLNKMSDAEIKVKCIEIRPFMQTVFEVWDDSNMKNFQLTSVGIAIGHANIKRLSGEFADLSIWIN